MHNIQHFLSSNELTTKLGDYFIFRYEYNVDRFNLLPVKRELKNFYNFLIKNFTVEILYIHKYNVYTFSFFIKKKLFIIQNT